MIRPVLLFTTCLIAGMVMAQENGFPYGGISIDDLKMTTYDKDTSAAAVYLNEYGQASVDWDTQNIIFEYHARIKILRPEGMKEADWGIPLYHEGGSQMKLTKLTATTFNLDQNQIVRSDIDIKSVFVEKTTPDWNISKFTLPNVHPGSILELAYTVEDPWKYNFHEWNFQADIPKVRSEYRATIPGNWVYNMTLIGFLKFTKSSGTIVKDCFGAGMMISDCAQYKYLMTNIPAFIEEDYMTAASNFRSAIHFELSELRNFDGSSTKFTETWEDAETKLERDNRFGGQLKRGKDIANEISTLVAKNRDSLERAKMVFEFIKNHYHWNGDYSKYSDLGIKKAFDKGEGNVADINLSLVAALRFAGLKATPLVLSTRDNGTPIEVHPVLSDFNYVIAKLDINKTTYLLDATDHDLPFGMIPVRCLNGKGRVFGDGHSYWYDLKPSVDAKEYYGFTLKVTPEGQFKGQVTCRFSGYSAFDKRKEIASFSSRQDYIKHLETFFHSANISNDSIENSDQPDLPLVESYDIELTGFDDLNQPVLLFNPFLVERITKNPFKSNDRLYPVDFGRPLQKTVNILIELPEGYEPANLPDGVSWSLPAHGGRFACDAHMNGNILNLQYLFNIAKPVYTSGEYLPLKEFYSRIVQTQATDVMLRSDGK